MNKIIASLTICCFIIVALSIMTYREIMSKRITKIYIPEELVARCPIPQPPSVDSYKDEDWLIKEVLLVDYSRSLIKNNRLCNEKLDAISELNKID